MTNAGLKVIGRLNRDPGANSLSLDSNGKWQIHSAASIADRGMPISTSEARQLAKDLGASL